MAKGTVKHGVHPGVTLADYVADCFHGGPPSLNAGVAHVLLTRSPWHAWYAHPGLNPQWEPDATEATDVGAIAHALLLENDRSRVHVVDAKDWRTKAAQEQRQLAWAMGKLPVLAEKMTAITDMVIVARAALERSELGQEFAVPDRSLVENTLLWEDEGVLCRCRPDWHSADWRIVLDYKTTGGNAEPNAWGKSQLANMGNDLQAAMMLRATAALQHGHQMMATVVFLCQETDPPYAVSLVSLAPAYLAFAEQRLQYARNQWRHCLETDTWPSYPGRIAYVDPPPWAVHDLMPEPTPVDDGRPLYDQLFGGEKLDG